MLQGSSCPDATTVLHLVDPSAPGQPPALNTPSQQVLPDCAKALTLLLQGYYCPDATTILPCPEGKFCKWWTRRPKSCPWLASCPYGSDSADLSLAGFFFMLLILLVLWLAYAASEAYIRYAT